MFDSIWQALMTISGFIILAISMMTVIVALLNFPKWYLTRLSKHR